MRVLRSREDQPRISARSRQNEGHVKRTSRRSAA